MKKQLGHLLEIKFSLEQQKALAMFQKAPYLTSPAIARTAGLAKRLETVCPKEIEVNGSMYALEVGSILSIVVDLIYDVAAQQ